MCAGECISYGARVLNEGGYHAIPKLTFPGGALIGCSAGFLNRCDYRLLYCVLLHEPIQLCLCISVKVKGTHTAMKSGMVAAEAVHAALTNGNTVPVSESGEVDLSVPAVEVSAYQQNLEKSWVYEELKIVRNAHAAFHYGTVTRTI